MERSPPSPQIYQKFICMWNSPHRTPSEPWQKTPDFQKGKPISSEWGRAKDTGKKDTVGLRWDLHPREGVVEGKVFTRLKTPRRQFWGEIQNLRGEQSNRCVEGKMERISLRGLCWTALPSQKGWWAGRSGSGSRGWPEGEDQGWRPRRHSEGLVQQRGSSGKSLGPPEGQAITAAGALISACLPRAGLRLHDAPGGTSRPRSKTRGWKAGSVAVCNAGEGNMGPLGTRASVGASGAGGISLPWSQPQELPLPPNCERAWITATLPESLSGWAPRADPIRGQPPGKGKSRLRLWRPSTGLSCGAHSPHTPAVSAHPPSPSPTGQVSPSKLLLSPRSSALGSRRQ